jgi:hypothetical protein
MSTLCPHVNLLQKMARVSVRNRKSYTLNVRSNMCGWPLWYDRRRVREFAKEEEACLYLWAKVQEASATRAYLEATILAGTGGLVADYLDCGMTEGLQRRERSLEAGRDQRDAAAARLV